MSRRIWNTGGAVFPKYLQRDGIPRGVGNPPGPLSDSRSGRLPIGRRLPICPTSIFLTVLLDGGAIRAQGDVRLRSGSGGITPVSGHPLLIRAALESLKRLGTISLSNEAEAVFHFSLFETAVWIYGKVHCLTTESSLVATD
jgi:hypothetical protein